MPDLPDPLHVASQPWALGGGDLTEEGAAAHVSDLAALEELALQYGFRTADGEPHELFRSPDSVRRALASSG